MAKLKALHAADGLLLEFGYVDYRPQAGQFVRDVQDEFNEEPRKRRWNGASYDDVPPPPPPTPEELEAEVQAILNGGAGPHIDPFKLLKAKFISDLAWRLGKAPGALTGAELTAERNRIANIYKALP